MKGHSEKHGREFGSETEEYYLQAGHDVMKNGDRVEYQYKGEIRTVYVQYLGNTTKGDETFAFVGTNAAGEITTIHTKSGIDLWKTLNGDSKDKTIRPTARRC